MALTTTTVEVPIVPATDDIDIDPGVPASTAGTLTAPVGDVAALTDSSTTTVEFFTWRMDVSGLAAPLDTAAIVGVRVVASTVVETPGPEVYAGFTLYGVTDDSILTPTAIDPDTGNIDAGVSGIIRPNTGALGGGFTFAGETVDGQAHGIIVTHSTNDVSDVGPTEITSVTLTLQYDEDHSGLQPCVVSDSCQILTG